MTLMFVGIDYAIKEVMERYLEYWGYYKFITKDVKDTKSVPETKK